MIMQTVLFLASLCGMIACAGIITYCIIRYDKYKERKLQEEQERTWWDSKGPYDIRPVTNDHLERKRNEPWEC